MKDLEPTLATAVQERGSGRFDPGWEPGRIRMLPICREDLTGIRTDRDNHPSAVSTTLQVNTDYAASVQFCAVLLHGGLARIKELRPPCICDVHAKTPAPRPVELPALAIISRSYQRAKWPEAIHINEKSPWG
jgi:hypothetical protein